MAMSTSRNHRRVSLDGGQQPGHQDGTGSIEVHYLHGQLYAAETRGHLVLTDQPASVGGEDAAVTPTELLATALGSCVAFYAGQYLARHGFSRDGLQVTAEFTMATDRPARIGDISLKIRVPDGVPPEREAALLAVASHCTVHNTLRQAPEIAIELVRPSSRQGGQTGAH
jgi:putative redox protein